MTIQAWEALLGAYLLGAVPSAYMVARFVAGVDIRQVGDGNMGAKNTFESVGKLAGVAVGVADVGKGALAVAMARYFSVSEEILLLAGACAVLGHDFPLFLRFRGGQGMAPMVGVFGVLFPQQMVLALWALAIALVITHNWDLSCAAGFVTLVILMWLAGQPPKRLLYVFLLLPTLGLRKLMQAWQAHRVAA
jgi:glycerol-3-phosphate acyltransferase PlsY